jgi:catechol 2,3-dioxygenase-like lactoylglutathione lyase family enzyme
MARIAIKGFNLSGISVADLDRCVSFFTEALGFTVRSIAPRDPAVIGAITGLGPAEVRIAYLEGPGHTLELLEYSSPRGRATYRTSDAGAMHVALDVIDMEAAVAEARHWGWRLMGEIVAIDNGPNKGRKIAYLFWNDQNLILELIAAP